MNDSLPVWKYELNKTDLVKNVIDYFQKIIR